MGEVGVGVQAQIIPPVHSIIPDEPIKVDSTLLFDRIP